MSNDDDGRTYILQDYAITLDLMSTMPIRDALRIIEHYVNICEEPSMDWPASTSADLWYSRRMPVPVRKGR